MIATILPGSSNFHAVLYNERKVAKGTARLIEMKNFGIIEDRDLFGQYTPEDLRAYLETYSASNSRISKTQFHLAVSCKGKEISEEELLDFAHAYLDEMGYGQEGQPLLVYAHRDTENNHIHIVTSRVAPDGTKINDSKERIRSQKAIDKILGQSAAKKMDKDFETAKGYAFSSTAQFKAILSSLGYESYVKDDTLYIKRQGTVQMKVKVSDIEPLFQKHGMSKKDKWKLRAIMLKYRNINTDVKGLQADLKKNFGLDLVFFGRKDNPYGYIIIDHKNKKAVHGGHILKMEDLLDFATHEERIGRIEALIDSILETNPKADTYAINKVIYRSEAYLKRGVLYINHKPVHKLNPIIGDTVLRNDKIRRIEAFCPVTQTELDHLCKIYKVERKDLLSLSSERDENTLAAIKKLNEIFDNPEISNVKKTIREAGFQIHHSEDGNVFVVDFKRHVIIDLQSAGFDMSRMEYKPRKRKEKNVKSTAVRAIKKVSRVRALRDAGGGSQDANREWEVGNKKGYDDIDDGRSLKM